METTSQNISDLPPEQRKAAEKLLGRSLVNFHKIVIRVLEEGNDIVIRFLGDQRAETTDTTTGEWNVPACFNVLTDLTDEEETEFDAVVSEPVTLSRRL